LDIFKAAYLQHVRALQRLISVYRGEATIDFMSSVLQVRARNRYQVLYPQFFSGSGRSLGYTMKLQDNVTGFAGWRPYLLRRWPIGTDKFQFKEYCREQGLPTPRMWRAPAADLCDFVVKLSSGSFGRGLRGPFRKYDPGNPAHGVRDDGYFEAFVRGRVLKAFYWQDRLACLEVLDMPSVEGDGRSTLRELAAHRLSSHAPKSEWQALADVAAYQETSLDAVPAKGRSVMIDYRYGSASRPTTSANSNALPHLQDSPITRQLVDYGRVLWQGIPQETRDATVFSVDAIADEQDRLWLLEMNANPVCHPDLYAFMFETFFGPADAAEAQATAAAAAIPADPSPAATAQFGPLPPASGARAWRLS
jgi:hypothetical protein